MPRQKLYHSLKQSYPLQPALTFPFVEECILSRCNCIGEFGVNYCDDDLGTQKVELVGSRISHEHLVLDSVSNGETQWEKPESPERKHSTSKHDASNAVVEEQRVFEAVLSLQQ